MELEEGRMFLRKMFKKVKAGLAGKQTRCPLCDGKTKELRVFDGTIGVILWRCRRCNFYLLDDIYGTVK